MQARGRHADPEARPERRTGKLNMSTQTLNGYGVIAQSGQRPGLFARVAAWLDEQRRYRRTVDELSQLSDRELADIGLYRDDIEQVARRSCYAAG